MHVLLNKTVAVIGLGTSGQAASLLLRERGARVVAMDAARTSSLEKVAADLRAGGVEARVGVAEWPSMPFDLAVTSPGVAPSAPLLAGAVAAGVPVIGELELGWQQSNCLAIGITGTNGKTTTTELVERMATQCGRRTIAAGNIGLPVSAVAGTARDLDFLTLEVSSFQLETIQFFRPMVAVLLNITPDHLDRYASMEEYVRAKGRIFMNQQVFDHAIIQWEALQQLRAAGVRVPSKVTTFSAASGEADLVFDRGLLVSRVPGWSGPLLNMANCRIAGPHNAENLMAALAVGRVLRLPIESVVEALQGYEPAPHRCESVAEAGGVRFINDSKATNVDALLRALQSIPGGPEGQPNIWLIAGGREKGFEFHSVGPELSRRVKGVFLIGEAREKLRASWSLFTPCRLAESLLEAVQEAAKGAVPGDVVLLSPACSSFDQFRNYQHRGEMFREAVFQWTRSASSAASEPSSSRDRSAGRIAPSPGDPVNPLLARAAISEGESRRDN